MTSAASTANAAVPAPGKLEFKDDYTPKEAERVIRNSKGLPVGCLLYTSDAADD